MEFKAWPKIPRLSNEKEFYTEKLDGTNACIAFAEDGSYHVQSRSRIITPEDDNYGFARWVEANLEELRKLGEGYHYGEWWGNGIQRGYDLKEKRFSLFNTKRWGEHNPNTPACCHVVPVINRESVDDAILALKKHGSFAAPGYMKIEGIVVYKYLTDSFYKVIVDK